MPLTWVVYTKCKQEARIDVLERHLIAHGDLLIDSQAPRRETENKYAASSARLSRLGARLMIISRASAIIWTALWQWGWEVDRNPNQNPLNIRVYSGLMLADYSADSMQLLPIIWWSISEWNIFNLNNTCSLAQHSQLNAINTSCKTIFINKLGYIVKFCQCECLFYVTCTDAKHSGHLWMFVVSFSST